MSRTSALNGEGCGPGPKEDGVKFLLGHFLQHGLELWPSEPGGVEEAAVAACGGGEEGAGVYEAVDVAAEQVRDDALRKHLVLGRRERPVEHRSQPGSGVEDRLLVGELLERHPDVPVIKACPRPIHDRVFEVHDHGVESLEVDFGRPAAGDCGPTLAAMASLAIRLADQGSTRSFASIRGPERAACLLVSEPRLDRSALVLNFVTSAWKAA